MGADIERNMAEKGISLPNPPAKGGLYRPCQDFGDRLVYVSGCGCSIDHPVAGKLGLDFTLEQGQQYARQSMMNVLAALKAHIGDLGRVRRAVKILVFVAGADQFYQQPQVANGASQLLVDVFGEEIGLPSRSAIGVNALPGNLPVEIEAIFELNP
ncbi:MAG: RidA family protein [Clostridiales bacterium]|nr:RidA family protein [Clostridiales bacterium]